MKPLLFTAIFSLSLMTIGTSYAARGNSSGGGGDASEVRVNEIRSDILNWISNGGAKGLILPATLTHAEYESQMKEILRPQKVVISFVEKDHEDNDELKVSVNGIPKTCRGFISAIDSLAHIVCNISRFKNTSESEQYKLIHHEYAGLVNIENNEGAASDYEISSQITDFLEAHLVLKLAVKSRSLAGKAIIGCSYDEDGYDQETLTLRMNGQKIESIEYLTYQGSVVGPFKKVGNFVFQYTEKELVINHIVSVSDDLKNAVLTVVYKDGNILSSKHFTCY